MKVKYLGTKGTWRDVANACRTTVSMGEGEGEPSSSWKKRMLLAEHSPIRKMRLEWKWEDLKYWVSVHMVRHKIGITHFVSSQRSDRGKPNTKNRDEAPQSTPVLHECEANFQSIINISRKRLCNQAHQETKAAWKLFLDEIVKPNEPELYEICVPECVYRGKCYEYEKCGFEGSKEYFKLKIDYDRVE